MRNGNTLLNGKAFNSIFQTTLAGSVTCSGVGLHTGKPVHLTLAPGASDTGIRFIRLDVAKEVSVIPAYYLNVSDTMLGTSLKSASGTSVSTVEHLMAALWGLGVDNAVVTLDGPEVPIMDGSSEPFVFLIECAGIRTLPAHRDTIEVMKRVSVKEGESSASIRPFAGFALNIDIEYPGTAIPRQQAFYDFGTQSFKHALCRARTFGFAADVEKLRGMGLALGGSLDNAIVVGDKAVINEEGLRFGDEFVRHKALDCVGDYFLSGVRIHGAVSTVRPGHGINNKLLRALLADRSAWRLTSAARAIVVSLPAPKKIVRAGDLAAH
jgi:UDP-3-O-[3-hydroxymyristoyl] N-acetylglucosamine deacetylase